MRINIKLFSLLFLILLSCTSFAITLNDNGRVSPTSVAQVIHIHSEADILNAIQLANSKHIPIAIMGKQHSQGGQSLANHAIELDMLSFNKVIRLDTAKKQITVQSGITWSDLQKYINSYQLAIKSMQSPNIFTVGGSMSVNAHGDDFRAGAVGNSIVSFEMILANGKKVFVSRSKNPSLWSAVIGGYGFFGVITNVTLQLTDNVLLHSQYEEKTLAEFSSHFRTKILNNNDVVLFYAHVDIMQDDNFLQNMYVITYIDTHQLPKSVIPLDNPEKWNTLLKPIFNFSRNNQLGKKWRWGLEKKLFSKYYDDRVVTRNNAMEKPVRFASDYQNKYKADWLQEYFIPTDQLANFMGSLRAIALDNHINLLNLTIRYVPAEKDILLSYAKQNCFALVLYFNQDLSRLEIERTKLWTRELINQALAMGGNYYLPYQGFASRAQFQQAYPEYNKVIQLKNFYDPKHLFENKFYENYFEGTI